MLPLLTRLRHKFKTPDLKDIFRTIEWMGIATFGLVLLLAPTYKEWSDRLPLPDWSGYGLLAALFGLSWCFPVKRPLWQRRLYVAVAAGLLIASIFTGVPFDILLYLLIAKSCFLLNRRDLVVMLIGVGVAWNLAAIWLFQQSIALMNLQPPPPEALNTQRLFISAIVGSSGMYIVACTFVLLLSFTILREQRSRARAEQLTQEVEILAATVERSRIAREIHDSLGHTLTALNVQIELAQKLQQRDPVRSGQSIDIAQQLATQCLQDVRHAVHSMQDRTIDLNTAIQTLVQPLQNHSDLQFDLSLKFPALPPTFSHQIYCIIQEGLTNIQRHAGATHVQLQGERSGDEIVVSLQDNGIGFHVDQAATGFGLRSMSERAQSIDGRLQVESTPAQGTRLRLAAPAPSPH
jgi:signal transduction histidine kinase